MAQGERITGPTPKPPGPVVELRTPGLVPTPPGPVADLLTLGPATTPSGPIADSQTPGPLVLEHRGHSGGRTNSFSQHLSSHRPSQLMRTQRSPLRWRPTLRRTRTERRVYSSRNQSASQSGTAANAKRRAVGARRGREQGAGRALWRGVGWFLKMNLKSILTKTRKLPWRMGSGL